MKLRLRITDVGVNLLVQDSYVAKSPMPKQYRQPLTYREQLHGIHIIPGIKGMVKEGPKYDQ